VWRCEGDQAKHPYARAILAKHFPGVDAAASIEYFEAHGGYCDCEVLFNVDREPEHAVH
jgi:hypothetical protein